MLEAFQIGYERRLGLEFQNGIALPCKVRDQLPRKTGPRVEQQGIGEFAGADAIERFGMSSKLSPNSSKRSSVLPKSLGLGWLR